MLFDPLSALAQVIVGVYSANKKAAEADAWLRFGASLFGTAFVSFTGVWGMSIWALYPKLGVLAALVRPACRLGQNRDACLGQFHTPSLLG